MTDTILLVAFTYCKAIIKLDLNSSTAGCEIRTDQFKGYKSCASSLSLLGGTTSLYWPFIIMFSFGRGSQLVTFVLLLVSLLLTVHLSQALAIEKTNLSTPRSHQDIKRSNLDVFCKAFNKECFEKALAGQTGHVTVTHACQKQGGKFTKTFSFGCKRGKHDLTSKVLKAVVAQGYNVQTVGGTTTVTSRTGTTQVVYETKTLQIDATITSNAYQTIETTQSDVTGFTTATSLVTSTGE